MIVPNQRETAAVRGCVTPQPFNRRTAGRGQRVVLAETGTECRLVGEARSGAPVFYYADSDYTFEDAAQWLDSTY